MDSTAKVPMAFSRYGFFVGGFYGGSSSEAVYTVEHGAVGFGALKPACRRISPRQASPPIREAHRPSAPSVAGT
jgi:hypothetical protein